jgi:hypothetical protein
MSTRNKRDAAAHPEDYNTFGFPILMTVAEAGQYLGVDEATAAFILAAHRVPALNMPGKCFNRPDVRALRDVLISAGKLGEVTP